MQFMRTHRYPTGSQQLALDERKVFLQFFFELHAWSKEHAHIGNVFCRHIVLEILPNRTERELENPKVAEPDGMPIL